MADATKNGGPAFPTTPKGEVVGGVSGGISVRDWFAGQATEEDVAFWMETIEQRGEMATREMAKYAYADAMLAEREGA